MHNNSKKKRINMYDIAKGIGIILVYLGHVPPNIYFRRFIYSFHMPLFFIISGMLLNVNKYDMKGFFISRTKSLMIPAITFIAFSNIVGFIFSREYKPGLPSIIWFLFVLYFSELLIFICWKKIKNTKKRTGVCITLMLLAFFLDYVNFKLPIALNVIPLASFFVSFGYLFKEYILKWSQMNVSISIIGGGLFLLLVSLYIEDYNNLHKGHLILCSLGVIVAIIGSLSIINISKFIDSQNYQIKKTLIMLGKNSLIIYGVHLSLISVVGVPLFSDDIFRYCLLNILVIILITFITVFINKYAKFLLGKF